MERTVTIDGKEYPVRFNMSTLIAFEQTSDKSFFGENFDKLYSRVILVFAAMFAADDKITTEVLLNSNDWQGITRAFNTTGINSFDNFIYSYSRDVVEENLSIESQETKQLEAS